MVLLVPALAACALVAWWQGGRLAPALVWLGLAGWVVAQPIPGVPGYAPLARGWALLLAGTFGLACILRPRRALLDQALPVVGIALVLGMVVLLTGATPLGTELARTMESEYAARASDAVAWLQRLSTSPEWTVFARENPDAAALRRELQDQLAASYTVLPARSLVVLPAMLALESLATLAVAWGLHQRLGRVRVGPPAAPLRNFRFSDQLIWGLIVGITLVVLPALADLRAAGANLLLFFGALYVVRGLGVLSWLLAARRWTKVTLVAVGLLAWQLLAAFALALGVGDTWLDWRSRTRPTS
ncbi:MAG TPA: DUF2232 domain-containing protein [Gemmatimonadaceae bacterium]|nr:DUF2232 domain-containing protein [Gemmatimonadaceae bacterium]